MPHSGVKISDDVKMKYDRVFKREKKGVKNGDKLPYAIFKFSDSVDSIVVDYDPKFYSKHLSYPELVNVLPNNAPRFICFDFHHLDKDGNPNTSVILVSWFPALTPVKLRFLVGSSFLTLAATLNVNKKNYIEGEDADEISEANVCDNNGAWKLCPSDLLPPCSEDPLNIGAVSFITSNVLRET